MTTDFGHIVPMENTMNTEGERWVLKAGFTTYIKHVYFFVFCVQTFCVRGALVITRTHTPLIHDECTHPLRLWPVQHHDSSAFLSFSPKVRKPKAHKTRRVMHIRGGIATHTPRHPRAARSPSVLRPPTSSATNSVCVSLCVPSLPLS